MIAGIALGLAIGLALGALGCGGSILAVPVLAHLAGQTAAAATATSLVAVGAASVVGALGHARAGNVRWAAAAAFVLTGVPGAWAVATVNRYLDGDLLLLAFSGLVLLAAHRMLTACPSCTKEGERRVTVRTVQPARSGPDLASSSTLVLPSGPVGEAEAIAAGAPATAEHARPGRTPGMRVAAAGVIVGFLTDLFGVGGGFVIVPALTLALGLSMPLAIGTSLAVIVGNAAVALGFRGLDSVDWALALPFTATMLAGSFAGSLVAHRLPGRRSLQGFAALLVAVALGNAAAVLLA